jgi:hypothetical protein
MTACVLLFPWPEEGGGRRWCGCGRCSGCRRRRPGSATTCSRSCRGGGGPPEADAGGWWTTGVVKDDIREAVTAHRLNVLGLYYDPHYANELTQALHEGESVGGAHVPGVVAERTPFPQSAHALHRAGEGVRAAGVRGRSGTRATRCMDWQVGHCEVCDRNQNIRPVRPQPEHPPGEAGRRNSDSHSQRLSFWL